MEALAVYETSYGNTWRAARAIAEGLSGRTIVLLEGVTKAGPAVPDDVGILVAGGPTRHSRCPGRPREERHSAASAGGTE